MRSCTSIDDAAPAAKYRAALRLRPRFAEAQNNLGCALAKASPRKAANAFRAALEARSDYELARRNLTALETDGIIDEEDL